MKITLRSPLYCPSVQQKIKTDNVNVNWKHMHLHDPYGSVNFTMFSEGNLTVPII